MAERNASSCADHDLSYTKTVESVMAPCETIEDYYSILEISQLADPISIRNIYRRLAKIKHPDKNPTNPQATVEFQLVS